MAIRKVLFVCLGNICRSPAAHGIFQHLVEREGLQDQFHIDSAGTSAHYHAGEEPDSRMQSHARRRGYSLTHESRQLLAEDLKKFDLILTMDESNYRNVLKLDPKGEFHSKVKRMTSYCEIHEVKEVPDPYYSSADGFELVLDILEDACHQLLLEHKTKK